MSDVLAKFADDASAWFAGESWCALAEHTVAALAVIWFVRLVMRRGVSGLVGDLVAGLGKLPGVAGALEAQLEAEVEKGIKDLFHESDEEKRVGNFSKIPRQGVDRLEVLRKLRLLRRTNIQTGDGVCFALIYDWGEESHATGGQAAEDEEAREAKEDERMVKTHHGFTERAYNTFMHTNALNPIAFPALRSMENQVCQMVCTLFNGGPDAIGTMTSGGTESIICAMLAYRERGYREMGVAEGQGEIVLPVTAHPAFAKAAHLFHLKLVWTPVDPVTMEAQPQVMARAITKNTVALVVSACQYPHGIVDPVEEVAKVARAANKPLHVDGCVGGFILPWVERLGYKVPKWDFRVPGVTSISADLHKYAYAPKGASTISYSSDEYRKYQFYAFASWPGGVYVSPSMLGSRPGGNVAASWATLLSVGEEGFLEKAKGLMETSKAFQKAVNETKGIKVLGNPHASIISFVSVEAGLNIYVVADLMKKYSGWKLEVQQSPESLHLTIMPVHSRQNIRDLFVKDLRRAVDEARANPGLASEGNAAMYGNVAKIPADTIIEDFLTLFMRRIFTPTKKV